MTRKELQEKWQAQEGAESERHQVKLRLQDTEKQLEKSERLRQELADSYRKSETEHSHIVEAYKTRQNELNEKVT